MAGGWAPAEAAAANRPSQPINRVWAVQLAQGCSALQSCCAHNVCKALSRSNLFELNCCWVHGVEVHSLGSNILLK